MSKRARTSRTLKAANDNDPGGRRIVMRIDPDMPVLPIEVEIFDLLVPNIDALLAANDNDATDESKPDE